MPLSSLNVPISSKQRALLPPTPTSSLKSSFCPADPPHKSQTAWLALIWKTKMIVKRKRERDKRPRLPKDNARLPRSAKRKNANTLKYANACLALLSHLETHQPLVPLPLALEGTGLRAEEIEAEEAVTVPRETASPTLLPTSHLRVPSTSQTNSSILAMNRDRRALQAQDLPLPETSSLSANPEVLKDVVASDSLLAAPDRVHELALPSLCDMSRITVVMELLRPPNRVAARLNLSRSLENIISWVSSSLLNTIGLEFIGLPSRMTIRLHSQRRQRRLPVFRCKGAHTMVGSHFDIGWNSGLKIAMCRPFGLLCKLCEGKDEATSTTATVWELLRC